MTITEFLLARIAEDEADARKAARMYRAPRTWGTVLVCDESKKEELDAPHWKVVDVHPVVVPVIEKDRDWWYDEPFFEGQDWDGGVDERAAPHVARWDPARVLAECEAKRRIVERVWDQEDSDQHKMGSPIYTRADLEAQGINPVVLCLMAIPYADHPDHNPAWSVS